MKNPLNYQMTDYDCGPTTLFNALTFLFKREEIPPDVIKYIMLYCLDAYNDKGEYGKNGTSCMAMMFLSGWLNQFGKVKHFPVQCEYLRGQDVYIENGSPIVNGLLQGGAVVVRLRYDVWHYVLFTGVSDREIYFFDPYYRKQSFRKEGIEIITDQPQKCNRKVSFDILNNTGRGMYALGPQDIREAVLIYNRSSTQNTVKAIEYYI